MGDGDDGYADVGRCCDRFTIALLWPKEIPLLLKLHRSIYLSNQIINNITTNNNINNINNIYNIIPITCNDDAMIHCYELVNNSLIIDGKTKQV
jgi:hypothetical protein